MSMLKFLPLNGTLPWLASQEKGICTIYMCGNVSGRVRIGDLLAFVCVFTEDS